MRTSMLTRLDTNELRYAMQDDSSFIGVFPIDLLPRHVNKQKTIKLIVNLEPSNLPGSHWICIYRRNGKAYYFDTFGRIPPTDIQHWLASNSRDWIHNTNRVQSESDKISCGYICVYFLSQLPS